MVSTRHNSGFTLWELLVTLLVAGVILGLGAPNLMEFQRNNAIASASNDFVTSVLAARGEAIKRQVPVTLCASPDALALAPTCVPSGAGTSGGVIVWVDENGNTDADTGAPILTDATDGNAAVDAGETILRRIEAPGGQIRVFMDSGYIAYGPNGFVREVDAVARAPASRLLYCDDRGRGTAAGGLSAARLVQVQPTGRAQVLRGNTEIEQGIGDLTAAGVAVDCP